MKQVIFTIHNGEVKIAASGFTGGACDAATKGFEEILGVGSVEKKRTSEFYDIETPEVVRVGASI